MRRLEAQAEEPTLGAILARRYVSVLGSAEDLAARIQQVVREAGWEHIALGEIVGDGAPWIWNVAEAHFPGVRQTLDYDHLGEHFFAFAHLLYPNNPMGAKAWVKAAIPGEPQSPVTHTISRLPVRNHGCEHSPLTCTLGRVHDRESHVPRCPQRTDTSLRRGG